MESLCEFSCNLKYEDLPQSVITQAKKCILDSLAVITAGSIYSDSGKYVKDMLYELKAFGDSTVVGMKTKAHFTFSAFANAVMSHALELDDGSRHATYHPGSSIIPSLIAVAEHIGCGGKRLIEAVVCGYETSLRIGASVNPNHYLKGFHPTGTIGVFGCAFCVSKLLDLDFEKTLNAACISASFCSGINQYEADGSSVKHLHPANAAKNGIIASFSAKCGFNGPKDVLEGEKGFFKCYADEVNYDVITENLSKSFLFEKIYFKPYPSCRYVHYAVEAVFNILKQNPNLDYRDIVKINVKTHKNAKQGSDIPDYKSVLHARLSIQYGIATALVRRSASLKDYTEEAIRNKTVKDVALKVNIQVDPQLQRLYPDPRPMVVEIIDKNGNLFKSRVDYPKGDPENPMSFEDIKEKFCQLTSDIFDVNTQAEIINLVWNIQSLKDINILMSYFRF